MESRSKEQKGSGQCIGEIERDRDRLSELPDEVLVHILSFLSTKDAVETMLLKRFGNLWTLVPNLEFEDDDFEVNTVHFSSFSLFVHNVLINHKRPTIDKLVVRMREENWEMEDDGAAKTAIKMCIRFALSREAKTLELTFDGDDLPYKPSSIFKSQSLVKLDLFNCSIKVPKGAYMGSLRTFTIKVFAVIEGDMCEFLSCCPCLQELVIEDPSGVGVWSLSSASIEKLVLDSDPSYVDKWKINCPNLKNLELFVFPSTVEVIDVSSVCELTICSSYDDEHTDPIKDAHKWKSFLEQFQNIEVLTLRSNAVLQLTYCLMANAGIPQNRWKSVVLMSSVEDTNIAGICSLLRNSPCLEKLVIQVSKCTWDSKVDINMVSQEVYSPCVASHLRFVTMHGYEKPYDAQLQLIEFLLKSAVNLVELKITNWGLSDLPVWWGTKKLTSSEERKFFELLSKLSRASKNARIVFDLNYCN